MNTCKSPFFAFIFNYMILLAIKKKGGANVLLSKERKSVFHNVSLKLKKKNLTK